MKSRFMDGELIFAFDERGMIREFQNNAKLTEEQLVWLHRHFPVTLDVLKKHVAGSSARLTEVEPDLSFRTFWDKYAYKVGNKKRAERLWNNLPKTEKIKAMAYIRRYNQWLAGHPGINKLYPETYLNQQRWNNE